jgi:hypothetical protein
MVPIGFEALSLRDHVILLRLNVVCIAALLPVVLLFTMPWRWQTGVLVIAISGGLCILGCYAEPILRRLDATIGEHPYSTQPSGER